MSKLERFLSTFFASSKNAGIDICVLRNFSELPKRIPGSDIDISVRSFDKRRIVALLLSHAEKCGYTLNGRFNKSYKILHLRFVNREDLSFVKFDIMSDVGISNCVLWSQDYISQNSELQPNGLFRGPTLALQLAIIISYSIITKKCIKERYLQIIREQPAVVDEIRHHLLAVNIYLKALDIDSGAVKLQSRHKSIFATDKLLPSMRRLYDNIVRYIAPPGLMISFTGPDGSGKSTLIDSLIRNDSKFYSGHHILHLRPHFLPSLSSLYHNLSREHTTSVGISVYQKSNKHEFRSKIAQIFRLTYYWFDYVIGYWLKVRPLLARDHLVVFDRYYYDYYFDFDQKAVQGIDFYVKFLGFFVPKPLYNFILVADANNINDRKNELSVGEIETQYKRINSGLSHHENTRFIETDDNPLLAVDHVQSKIMLSKDKSNE